MLTMSDLERAESAARELKRVRAAIAALKEDSATSGEVCVEDLTRRYGTDRARAVARVSKQRILAMFSEEEASLVVMLRALGVDADAAGVPRSDE